MRGRVGWGGRACVWACVFALCSLRGFFLCLSLAPPFLLVRFSLFSLGGGGGRVRVAGLRRFWCLAWVWVRAAVGVGVGVGVVGDGSDGCCAPGSLCVCRPSGTWWLPVSGAPVRGALAAGGLRVVAAPG